MEEGAIDELIGSRGRKRGTIGRTPRTIASLNTLPSLMILFIKSISRYYRDNEYPEALII